MCGNICGKEKCCSGVFLQPDVDISIKKKKKLHHSQKELFMQDFKIETKFIIILYVPNNLIISVANELIVGEVHKKQG